jgi:hypothetical protein
MKTVISKKKRDEIETLLYAGIGAVAMSVSMSGGNTTDGTIMIRNKVVKQVLDILDNK